MSRFQFICMERGCGPCGVKLIDAVYLETRTHDGELIASESAPRLVSTCCGAGFEIWDNRTEDTAVHQAAIAEQKPFTQRAAPQAEPKGTEAPHERVKRWAEQHHVCFVSRSHGLASTDTISFAALEALAAQAPAVGDGPLTEEDITRALNFAYQFRSHPASRSIDEIEQAGELILLLLSAPQAEREPLSLAVVDAARAAMDESVEAFTDRMDIIIPAHLASALSLRLDEYDRAHGIGAAHPPVQESQP